MSTITKERGTMKKSKACRCLFGPVDHDSVRKDLDSQLSIDSVETTNSWNFNFREEAPLEGRYEWTEVNDYVPEFYRKGYSARVPPTPRKMNVRPQLTPNTIIQKPTAVRRLNNLFCDSIESGESTALSNSVSSTVSTSSSPVPPSTPRTPRVRRSRNIETASQSRISDFMNVRKRRIDCDSPSAMQRKLPRI